MAIIIQRRVMVDDTAKEECWKLPVCVPVIVRASDMIASKLNYSVELLRFLAYLKAVAI